jgi:enoyl-CoA hydratase
MSDEADILFERRGAVGLITLNRPKALNALTYDMAMAMRNALRIWEREDNVKTIVIQGAGERAFCAGGDIRWLYDNGKAARPCTVEFYRHEYLLNALIKHYPKPYVALLRGIVMGGGVGVSVHGSHRIADESMLFAMPETGIGLFPDVGGSYFLPRCLGRIGVYLGLTGARLKTADALYAGVATHFVPAAKRDALLGALADGKVPDMAMQGLFEPVPDAFLSEHREKIDRMFGGESVEAILAALDADHTDWSADTARTIRAKSPTATKLAFRQIREGANLDFDDCMRMEFRMVSRVIAGHEFYEGVRATIIDKDGAPKWSPATLADVSDADIDAYFQPLPGDYEKGGLLFQTVLELDASDWKTPLDFHEALLAALGAPRGHGRSINALIDSMVHGGINAIEAPYTIRVVRTANIPPAVRQEIADVVEAIEAAQGTNGDIAFQIDP